MGRKPVSKRDISEAKDPILRASPAAMERAAALARKVAIETDTAIVLVEDGKIVRIPASELRKRTD
jgi:imidazolonepropionase-like amidohydrolase